MIFDKEYDMWTYLARELGPDWEVGSSWNYEGIGLYYRPGPGDVPALFLNVKSYDEVRFLRNGARFKSMRFQTQLGPLSPQSYAKWSSFSERENYAYFEDLAQILELLDQPMFFLQRWLSSKKPAWVGGHLPWFRPETCGPDHPYHIAEVTLGWEHVSDTTIDRRFKIADKIHAQVPMNVAFQPRMTIQDQISFTTHEEARQFMTSCRKATDEFQTLLRMWPSNPYPELEEMAMFFDEADDEDTASESSE